VRVMRASHIDELILLQVVFLELLVCFIEGTEATLVPRHGASNAVRHMWGGLLLIEASYAVVTMEPRHGCVAHFSVGVVGAAKRLECCV
jgi:hypothetical protein